MVFQRLAVVAAAAIIGLSTVASADTVSFGPTGWLDQNSDTVGTDWNVSITDIAGGVSFSSSLVAGSSDTGDILMIGLEGTSLAGASYTNVATNTGDGVTNVCPNTNSCGGGGGFNGGIYGGQNGFEFDTVVRIGTNGSSSGLNTVVSFDIILGGLKAADFTHVGLRLQTVGTNPGGGGGSLQIINDPAPNGVTGPLPPVPLPAGMLLLLGGLGGFGALRMRRRA